MTLISQKQNSKEKDINDDLLYFYFHGLVKTRNNFGLKFRGSLSYITNAKGEIISDGFHSFQKSVYHFSRNEEYLVGVLGACKYLLKPVVENNEIVRFKKITEVGFHSYEYFSYYFCGTCYEYLVGVAGASRCLLKPIKKKGEIVDFKVISQPANSFTTYKFSNKNYYALYIGAKNHYYGEYVFDIDGTPITFEGEHQFDRCEFDYLGHVVEIDRILPRIEFLDLFFKNH